MCVCVCVYVRVCVCVCVCRVAQKALTSKMQPMYTVYQARCETRSGEEIWLLFKQLGRSRWLTVLSPCEAPLCVSPSYGSSTGQTQPKVQADKNK